MRNNKKIFYLPRFILQCFYNIVLVNIAGFGNPYLYGKLHSMEEVIDILMENYERDHKE